MIQQVRPAIVRIETSAGVGSGAIFDTQGQTGYVITNHHVIDGASQATVIVNDSSRYPGTILGSDPTRDLAVIRICCARFTTLPFGNASNLKTGDEIIAIGYALGLQGQATATRGIVSAIRYDTEYRTDVIQTDAAINPGNSGGPMLSPDGKILGINTFKVSSTSVEGLGFAISGTTVQQLIPSLRTAQARPTPTPTRRPTATPFPTRRPTPAPSGNFGPESGELWHDPDDGSIELQFANVDLSHFMAAATFVNPYSAASNDWDYGFIIRRQGTNQPSIHIVVTSDRNWILKWRSNAKDAGTSQEIARGRLPSSFNTGAGGRNNLWLTITGNTGLLFVNDEFVSMLDLSAHTGAGDIAISTGNFTGGEAAGAVTRYEDFSVWPLGHDYGPASGTLEYEPGFISKHNSSVWTNDLVTEATFTNPPGSDWSYGFLIRRSETNRLEVIVVTGNNRWFHETRDVGDSEYTTVAEGRLSPHLSNRNHLLLMALEEVGILFVNGDLVEFLELPHNLDYGAVSAIGGFFNNHTGEPEFQNFNVWTP